jgi:hypothetical protein
MSSIIRCCAPHIPRIFALPVKKPASAALPTGNPRCGLRNLRAEFDSVIATLRWEASMNLDRLARALYLMEFLPALGLSIRVARIAV